MENINASFKWKSFFPFLEKKKKKMFKEDPSYSASRKKKVMFPNAHRVIVL